MVSKRQTLDLKTAADFTTRTEMGTIDIAVGGVLVAVEVAPIDFVLTTTQIAGGLVELENDSVDWKPFHLLTKGMDEITATSGGGGYMSPEIYECHKRLPTGSVVTVYYTADDAGNQSLGCTLCWETTLTYKGMQTYFKVDKGTEITQVTVDEDHNTISIPQVKAAAGPSSSPNVIMFFWKVRGTIEAGVQSGGKLVIDNTGPSWAPLEYMTGGHTTVVAGAAVVPIERKPVSLTVIGKTSVNTDFTPWDNQSQAIHFGIAWWGK